MKPIQPFPPPIQTYGQRRYPSVTEIIAQIPNPSLEAWKKETPNWREISQHALKVGSAVHKKIESFLKSNIFTPTIPTQNEIANATRAFLKWHHNAVYASRMVEKKVHSVQYHFRGTLDAIVETNRGLTLVDFKTSARIYDTYPLQIAAYKIAFEEQTREKIDAISIVRLDKYTGDYRWRCYTEKEYRESLDTFLYWSSKWHGNRGEKAGKR